MSARFELLPENRREYASPAALLDACKANPQWGGGSHPEKWFGFRTQAEAEACAVNGDMRDAEASDAALAKLNVPALPTSRTRHIFDVAGARPDVPRYLAGADPRTMRRRVRLEDEAAPVRVYVDLSVSYGVAAADVAKRGALVLALVRILATHRPLELYASCFEKTDEIRGSSRAVFWSVRLPTAPLDLPVCASWLGHVGIYRRLVVYMGGWRGMGTDDMGVMWPTDEKDVADVAEALGLGPRDVYITGTMIGELAATDAEAWIKDVLDRLGETEE